MVKFNRNFTKNNFSNILTLEINYRILNSDFAAVFVLYVVHVNYEYISLCKRKINLKFKINGHSKQSENSNQIWQ